MKYETFAPSNREPTRQELEQKSLLSAAYDDGFASGFQSGATASAEEHVQAQDQLRAQFLEALSDARLGHVEARADVLRSFLPVVTRIVAALTPKLMTAALAPQITEVITEALSRAPDATLVIEAAPELCTGLKAALKEFGARSKVVGNAALTPLEARIAWEDGFDQIDLSAAQREIDAVIDSFGAAIQLTDEKEYKNVG